MNIIIETDIKKSKGRQGLVLRKVPVRLPNGKISFANRWVQPNKKQGKGRTASKENQKEEKRSNIPSPFGSSTRPNKKQGKGRTASKEKQKEEKRSTVPSPFGSSTQPMSSDGVTPIVRESVSGGWEGADGYQYETELEALIGQYIGPDILYDSVKDEWSIDGVEGTFKTETQVYKEAHAQVSKNKNKDIELVLDTTKNFDDLGEYIDDIGVLVDDFMWDHDTSGDTINDWIDLGELAEEILDYYGAEIKQSVENSVPKDNDPSRIIQKRQISRGFGKNRNAFSIIGSDPRVLKTTLKNILGDEVYGKMRSQVEESTLSINISEENLGKYVIPEGEYKAATPERKLEREVGTEAVDKYKEIIGKIEDTEDWVLVANSLTSAYKDADLKERVVIHDIIRRQRYENSNIGIMLNDAKPVYIAYNLGNRELGGQDYYGESWIEISPTILKDCTVGKMDSYYGGDTVSVVHDMDHLHDLSILKALDGEFPVSKEGIMSNKMDESLGLPEWAVESYHEGDVPLELHYHKPEISMKDAINYHNIDPKWLPKK